MRPKKKDFGRFHEPRHPSKYQNYGRMKRIVQTGTDSLLAVAVHSRRAVRMQVFCLQGVNLVWMLVEFDVAAHAAARVHSSALLAFNFDSVVELISATLVLLQWIPNVSVSERKAARAASVLLFILAAVAAGAAIATLMLGLRPRSSRAGIAITIAALVAMRILARLKRQEAHRLGNAALAADATQAGTCAYLALIALIGLCMNAALRIAWFDAAAALAALPILLKEGRSAWRGQTCTCC